jgi:hypothetical protein
MRMCVREHVCMCVCVYVNMGVGNSAQKPFELRRDTDTSDGIRTKCESASGETRDSCGWASAGVACVASAVCAAGSLMISTDSSTRSAVAETWGCVWSFRACKSRPALKQLYVDTGEALFAMVSVCLHCDQWGGCRRKNA